ncbi:hypothetical protein QE363_000742 [Sphingomonas sp. SORGH_AS870]|uniref:hypothetical protein n=1 Tax=Sphingomonas sp. SORGH_AS_0870 TaxID=3041801 RepID=UPI002859A9B4|nr:hypothetical protein [Sphingomonas sp. SORGH_AS_0870]MDR6144949.1 hypothetical protein [Sphingomonas sp. SORGH_AS_0870]
MALSTIEERRAIYDRTVAQATTAAPLKPAASAPIAGVSAGVEVAGPFIPDLGRPITVALSAAKWPGGNAQILRSTDGGVTRLPLTPGGVPIGNYATPGVDQPWVETEAGATFYLTLPGAGITYRVAQ